MDIMAFAHKLAADEAGKGRPGKIGPGYGRQGAAAAVGSAIKHIGGAFALPLAPLAYPLQRLRAAGAVGHLADKTGPRSEQTLGGRAVRNVFRPGSAALHRVLSDLHDAGHGAIAENLHRAVKSQHLGHRTGLGTVRTIMQSLGLAADTGLRAAVHGAPAVTVIGASTGIGSAIEQAGSRKHFVRGLKGEPGASSSVWRRFVDPVGASQHDVAAAVKARDPRLAERVLAALHGRPIPGGLGEKAKAVGQSVLNALRAAGSSVKDKATLLGKSLGGAAEGAARGFVTPSVDREMDKIFGSRKK